MPSEKLLRYVRLATLLKNVDTELQDFEPPSPGANLDEIHACRVARRRAQNMHANFQDFVHEFGQISSSPPVLEKDDNDDNVDNDDNDDNGDGDNGDNGDNDNEEEEPRLVDNDEWSPTPRSSEDPYSGAPPANQLANTRSQSLAQGWHASPASHHELEMKSESPHREDVSRPSASSNTRNANAGGQKDKVRTLNV